LTACLAVLGRYVRNLEFFSILLGDEPVLEPHVVYYQRLLARDPDEASDLVEEFIQTHSPEEVYDRVFVPALVLACENRERGASTVEEHQLIIDVTRELLQEVLTHPLAEPAAEDSVVVFGCPAR